MENLNLSNVYECRNLRKEYYKSSISNMRLVRILSKGKICKEFYTIGKKVLHRDTDNPAKIIYYTNGKIKEEHYYKVGKLHRGNDNPAIIRYNMSGIIEEVEYYNDGKLYREDNKPMIINYYADGTVKSEKWCDKDRCVKLIKYRNYGTIVEEINFTNNRN